ncbi:LysR substrate-binding domain-containing protein [Ancylobacter mangrovi]|uniref:LysR substrate-binding domain-containing protein n=1 Tax=Ancylobacter mangrovi TaxID=2972472 RepID=UPI002163C7EF|nr:LysR substrate-binding domain-containing protein [Ancylobacter mangrovi]MCS0502683.1 LysR substrate-binding domain-containing protein [Ancylobacter mangrovi]
MDLRHLRYFTALAEELHFGRAAQRLGISQPPLSQQIHALELELGAELFIRTSRRVELTEAGRLFLAEARAVLSRAEQALIVGQRAGRGEIGELRIGFTASAPLASIMPTLIHTFREQRPDVHLTLREMLSHQQMQELLDGSLDVAFLRTPADPSLMDPRIAAIELQREELLVFLPKSHPLARTSPRHRIALAELHQDVFVHFSREAGAITYDQFIELCRAAGFRPRIGQEAREAVTIIGLVAAGVGITIMAASLRNIRLANVVTRRLAEPAPCLSTWLAHLSEGASPTTQAFLALGATAGP